MVRSTIRASSRRVSRKVSGGIESEDTGVSRDRDEFRTRLTCLAYVRWKITPSFGRDPVGASRFALSRDDDDDFNIKLTTGIYFQ